MGSRGRATVSKQKETLMMRWQLAAFLFLTAPLWPCDCAHRGPAAAYLQQAVIFRGRAVEVDAGGRARFEIEERFQGLAGSPRPMWVNPDRVCPILRFAAGQSYLVFAERDPGGAYYSPGCGGTRALTLPSRAIEYDLATLRALRDGHPPPRLIVQAVLFPWRGWPWYNGPEMEGVRLTIGSQSATFRGRTDAHGRFTVQQAPRDCYQAWAAFGGYRATSAQLLHAEYQGSGYGEVRLATSSTLEGIVLGHDGRPAANLPVEAELAAGGDNVQPMTTTTGADGRFLLSGIPPVPVRLAAGPRMPSSSLPWHRTRHAARFHLRVGEHRTGMVLWLAPPLETGHIHVRVMAAWATGNPCVIKRRPLLEAAGGRWIPPHVTAWDERGQLREEAFTNRAGTAELPCLTGTEYRLRATIALSSVSGLATARCGEEGTVLLMARQPASTTGKQVNGSLPAFQ
jgi:hypothetical protein